jgi:hypothetical protein
MVKMQQPLMRSRYAFIGMLVVIAVTTALLVPARIACAQVAGTDIAPGLTEQVPRTVIVSGSASISVNGTYTLGVGEYNGQPFWSKGQFYLFYSGNDWVICHCPCGLGGGDASGCYCAEETGPSLNNILGPWLNYGSGWPAPTVSFG